MTSGLNGTAEFDLNQRPESYWPMERPRAGLIQNEMQRRVIRASEVGDWSKVTPPVPFAMRGGDFLAKLRPHEVEIARISLESTTWDVISIRARPRRRGIIYSADDEYSSRFRLRPQSTKRPLSLGQLIALLDGMIARDEFGNEHSSSPAAIRDSNGRECGEEEIDDYARFVTVSSDFYPDLKRWYEIEAERWAQERRAALRCERRINDDAGGQPP